MEEEEEEAVVDAYVCWT